jgi:hypothetical protein
MHGGTFSNSGSDRAGEFLGAGATGHANDLAIAAIVRVSVQRGGLASTEVGRAEPAVRALRRGAPSVVVAFRAAVSILYPP